jgi:hypothetical protein
MACPPRCPLCKEEPPATEELRVPLLSSIPIVDPVALRERHDCNRRLGLQDLAPSEWCQVRAAEFRNVLRTGISEDEQDAVEEVWKDAFDPRICDMRPPFWNVINHSRGLSHTAGSEAARGRFAHLAHGTALRVAMDAVCGQLGISTPWDLRELTHDEMTTFAAWLSAAPSSGGQTPEDVIQTALERDSRRQAPATLEVKHAKDLLCRLLAAYCQGSVSATARGKHRPRRYVYKLECTWASNLASLLPRRAAVDFGDAVMEDS